VFLERRDQRLDVVADDLVAQDQLVVVVAQDRAVPQAPGVVQVKEQRSAADERLVVAPKVVWQPLRQLRQKLPFAAGPLDERAHGDGGLKRE
jgi:hypothetical protein